MIHAYRAELLSVPDDPAVGNAPLHHADGLLVVEDGHVVAFDDHSTVMVCLVGCVIAVATASMPATARSTVRYVDLATPFERSAIDTLGQSEAMRIATIRTRVSSVLPGIYPHGPAMDRLIADALAQFSANQAAYHRVIADFPAALNGAVARFRKVFPQFTSPIPIYLYHSLGQRDGGLDYLEPDNRHVMLFGADMIAEYHSDDSLQPFLAHELFHLEHARSFSDCDQFWCTLWQEGLAVDAAATMTPNATDHQLLLDIPVPIRALTDAKWSEALCFVATHFDDTKSAVTAKALQMGGNPPNKLPERFGYYVGFRLAQGTRLKIPQLARLNNKAARPVVRAALIRLMKEANAGCALPAIEAAVTYRSPSPV